MTFVFPALLGGLAAAGIPVLLHLILRQKPKTLPFPAFRFLAPRSRSNTRRLQLRHLLLLLLRIVLLAGLILAIARPRLLERSLGISSERPVAAVFVFDVSPSEDHRSADNRSRLDDAKTRALELLQELPPGSRIEVLTSSDAPSVRGDWLLNPAQARERIQKLTIQPASPPLDRATAAALRHLAELANNREDEPGTRLPRLLCVFSDSTRGAWDPSQAVAVHEASDVVSPSRETLQAARADLQALLAMLKEGSDKYPRVAGVEQPLTFLLKSVDDLQDRIPRIAPAEFPLKDQPAQMVRDVRQTTREALRLLAPSDPTAKVDDDVTRWSLALGKVLRSLSGQETLWFDVGMEPLIDISIVRIEWPQRHGETIETIGPDETLQLRAVIEAAGQDFQTTVECIHPKGKLRRPVEVKAGQPTIVPFDLAIGDLKLGPGYHSLEFHLDSRDAWTGNNHRFATFLVREPKKVLVVSDRAVPSDDLLVRGLAALGYHNEVKRVDEIEKSIPTGFDAIYLYAAGSPSDAIWEKLADFVRGGGSLAIIPGGTEMQAAAYRTDTARRVMPGDWKAIIALKKDQETGWSWRPESIFRHPILKPFDGWRRNSEMTFVKFPPRTASYWEVTPHKDVAVLVSYADKDRPALLERRLSAGKVIQFTTTLDGRTPAWNNYDQLSSFYIPLLGMTTKYLTGDSEPVRCNFQSPVEEASVPIRGLVGRKLRLQGVDPIAVAETGTRLPIPQAAAPGNYFLQDELDKSKPVAFSVNLTTEEVTPARMAKHEIENVFGADAVVTADRKANLRDLLVGHWNEPVELFPYFMVAILLLLAIENLLANRFYRASAEE
jgi:hypothetical protein